MVRVFDAEVLEIDKERIRMAYADRGYFAARVTDTAVTSRRTTAQLICSLPFKKVLLHCCFN